MYDLTGFSTEELCDMIESLEYPTIPADAPIRQLAARFLQIDDGRVFVHHMTSMSYPIAVELVRRIREGAL